MKPSMNNQLGLQPKGVTYAAAFSPTRKFKTRATKHRKQSDMQLFRLLETLPNKTKTD